VKILLLGGASLTLLASTTLLTDYERERSVRTSSTTTTFTETVEFEMEIDGEPVESPFGGAGGGGSTEERSVVTVDRVLETEDGAPTSVRRFFEEIEGTRTFQARDEEMVSEREAPLEDVVLEVGVEGAEVVRGEEPDHEDALEGHLPTLVLEGLLPDDDVEPGDTWDLEPAAIQAALGVDLERAYFAPPSQQGRGERGGGGGGGRRGGMRGGQGTSFMSSAEWEGSATLLDELEEHEGHECLVIELDLTAEGEMEIPERGGRGGGGGLLLPDMAERINEATYEVELTGRLLFATDLALPVRLELEGDLTTDSTIEREGRGGGVMTIYTRREGTLEHAVTIEQVDE